MYQSTHLQESFSSLPVADQRIIRCAAADIRNGMTVVKTYLGDAPEP